MVTPTTNTFSMPMLCAARAPGPSSVFAHGNQSILRRHYRGNRRIKLGLEAKVTVS